MDKKEESRKLAILMDRITAAENRRDAAYGELWQDCYRRYRSQPLPRSNGSNIFVPHTFMQCEVIKARLREIIFSQRPYIAALPVEGGDVKHAENMQLLLDWQMNELMDLASLMGGEVAISLVVYGTGIAVSGCDQGMIVGNRLWDNTEKGIDLDMADYTTLVNNTLYGHPIGIYAQYCDHDDLFLNFVVRGDQAEEYDTGEYSLYCYECEKCALFFNRTPGKSTTLVNCTQLITTFNSNNWNMVY